ncbi:M949_RS01915 family surface polysaccharide biosynthesis protein [Sediminibacterium sp.]|uniref:M949_RS01915 family surface polysaccharide biosynthesis protein n=1 Tax=Sediminibacterium sp. TaxID=1917865 RepID=UPI002735BC24|nr:hypothetical protein [Sediminibacterium sp.]MDP3567666.1 hypothetical protein [Sediminibacterium sp.]
MKLKLFFLSLFFLALQFSAQKNAISPIILSRAETKQLFSDEALKKFNIDYPIFRVYNYTDNTGNYYVVLTEKMDSIKPSKDTLHYKIKAFNFSNDEKGLVKKWELTDFVAKQTISGDMENSIWFWTKYCEFQDIDNDGLVDPIIVYGTSGMNGYEDGRIKILVYYKGRKNVIRHQNGTLDHERNTQVDETFYLLPETIQDQTKNIIQKMMDNSLAIFPYGWQEAMKKHKTKFQEK